jgi:hypothetical protein
MKRWYRKPEEIKNVRSFLRIQRVGSYGYDGKQLIIVVIDVRPVQFDTQPMLFPEVTGYYQSFYTYGQAVEKSLSD